MRLICLFILFFYTINFFAQKDLTLEDAVLKRWTSLTPEKLKDLKWNNEVDFFSCKTSDSIISLFHYNNILKQEILLSDINQSLEGEAKLLKIPSITWVNKHSFRFQNDSKFYLYNLERGNNSYPIFDIKKDAEHIQFNNQHNKYAYTIKNNLYISLGLAEHIKVTDAENKDVIYGQVVHRYEFGINKGIFWSNNGEKVAFYRKDETMVSDYPLLYTDSKKGYSDIIKYPMAGAASHHVSLGVYNISTGQIIYLDTGIPKEQYLTNVVWDPSDRYIYVVVLNRDQNHLKLNQYSSIDGSFIQTLLEEKSDTYIQPLYPMEFIDDNTFLWRSERNGFDNLYLYNINGKLIKNLLNKSYVIKDYYGYRNGHVYFSSYSKDGLAVDLWNVGINKKYKKKIVSDGYYHSFQLSPVDSYFLDEYSSLEIPRVIRVINAKGNELASLLEASNPLSEYSIGSTDLIKIKTDENISLNARIIKPFSFDKTKKYPVLIYVYNGPGIQLIRNNWLASTPLWMYYLANKDYIVFTVDGRGSENRGRDFEQCIFRELGKIEMVDQIKGYNYLLEQDFVDPSRIAVHGWSYGGFMTTNLLLTYPNIFSCGVAGGPVTNWEYYEIMYTERYMDHPSDNPIGYEKTNLINRVSLLESPLLMIHGLIDDVVLPQHSLDFLKSAVENDIQMEYFIYPGHAHNVRGKDRLHLMEKIINFIIRSNN